MRLRFLLIFALVFAVSATAGRKKASDPENIQLPADFAIDYQLGITQHAQKIGNTPQLTDGPVYSTGSEVFDTLTRQSMIEGLGLPYKWKLTILKDDVVNAGSLANGEIEVNGANGGMAQLLAQRPGLWAAVLSHEISHTANRHQVRQYLYQQKIAQELAYYRWRVQNGDKNANWSIVGLQIGSAIGEKKLARDQEHDADLKGMLLMARAGYHPDNVFALHHLLRLRTGEQSKFGAFFSDHPRWETRDQREEKEYVEALSEYQRMWPDPAQSPGGVPPAVVFVGKPEVQKDKKAHVTHITVPATCRNSSTPLRVAAIFTKDGRMVPSLDNSLKNDKGDLVWFGSMACDDQTNSVAFNIPSGIVAEQDRKLKANIAFLGTDNIPLEVIQNVEVEILK